MSRRIWTPSELEILEAMYPDHPAGEIAKKLSRPVSSVHGKAHSMGLKKSDAFYQGDFSGRGNLVLAGIKTRFKKGQPSHNKGKKFPTRGRAAETQFKPGHLPHNSKTDGTISTRKMRDGRRYKWIRISVSRWKLLHRHTWEAANGPIPKGYNVQFKDGNTMNCELDNLVLVSRGQNMLKNTIHNYPDELKQTIRVIGKLKKAIKDAEE